MHADADSGELSRLLTELNALSEEEAQRLLADESRQDGRN
jgi:hypothetical protein